MKAVAAYLRVTRRRGYATPAGATARLAAPKASSHPPAAFVRDGRVSRTLVAESDVYVVAPHSNRPAEAQAALIYLHGGAYVGEIQSQHWHFIAYLADSIGVEVQVPIYGLAPDHHVEEALELLRELMARRATDGRAVYLVGDSAGGGLAVAATRCWLDAGGRPPLGLTLIAPWLDIALTNPDIDSIEPHDPWLTRVGLRIFGQAWAGSVPLDDFRVSPLFADFDDFPPIDVYVGDHDIAVADCRLLRDKVPAGRLDYHEEPGAVHVYPLLPVPEGRAARRKLADHVASRI